MRSRPSRSGEKKVRPLDIVVGTQIERGDEIAISRDPLGTVIERTFHRDLM